MQSMQKKFGIAILLTMLLSTLPISDARADSFLGMILKKVPSSPSYTKDIPIKNQVLLASGAVSIPFLAIYARKNPLGAFFLLCGMIATPYFIDYFTRKPLKEKRFDSDKLLHGTWKEKLLHIDYFISDVLLGWPYKDKKVVVKKENGKSSLQIKDEQFPGGYFGNFEACILNGALKSIALPFTVLATIKGAAETIKSLKDPVAKVKETVDAIKDALN